MSPEDMITCKCNPHNPFYCGTGDDDDPDPDDDGGGGGNDDPPPPPGCNSCECSPVGCPPPPPPCNTCACGNTNECPPPPPHSCPCVKYENSAPANGLVRNINGDIIRNVEYASSVFEPYTNMPGTSLQYRYDEIYAADGTSLQVRTVVGAKRLGTAVPYENFASNCLG